MTTEKHSSPAELELWHDAIITDLRRGKIISCTKRRIVGQPGEEGIQGTIIMRGRGGPTAELNFVKYDAGQICVVGVRTGASLYYGAPLNWEAKGDYGAMREVSTIFARQLNALAQDMKFEQVAQMRRPLRWWYLLRN